jgi:hypothetical protein
MTTDDVATRIRDLYRAFNAREIDEILAHTTADLDWPNAWEGGRVVGHEAVRAYWTRQWAAIDPSVEPVSIEVRADGSVVVDVAQSVRDLDGALISEGRVLHVYVLQGDLVARMDVQERI